MHDVKKVPSKNTDGSDDDRGDMVKIMCVDRKVLMKSCSVWKETGDMIQKKADERQKYFDDLAKEVKEEGLKT